MDGGLYGIIMYPELDKWKLIPDNTTNDNT